MATSAETNPSTGFGDIDGMVEKAGSMGGAGIPTSSTEVTEYAFLGYNKPPPRGPALHADQRSITTTRPKYGTTTSTGPWPEYSKDYVADRIFSVDDAVMQAYSWRDKQFDSWAKLLVDEGILRPGKYNREMLIAEWAKAVMGSSSALAAGKKVTPQDYVRIYSGLKGANAISQARTVTQTNSRTQDISDLDARLMANEAFQEGLGASASPAEQRALHAALNAYVTNHPELTTETRRYNDDGDIVATNSRTSGGLTPGAAQQIATEQVQGNRFYAEYQAAGHYFPMFLQAIQAPVDLDTNI